MLSAFTCLQVRAQLLILYDLIKLLLDLLDINRQLVLHAAKINKEVGRELIHTLNAVTLLLLNLAWAGKCLPDAHYFLLFKGEKVFVENSDFCSDTCNQTLDIEHLIRQVLNELSRVRHFLNVLIVLLFDDFENVVNFLPNLLLAVFHLAFDLLKQDPVHLVELLLQSLLEVSNPDYHGAHE